MESLPLGTEVTLREPCFSSVGALTYHVSLSWPETRDGGMPCFEADLQRDIAACHRA